MRDPSPDKAGSPPGLRLHQVEGFFHVATHQGYTRAAKAMPYAITEPALHQQVRKLERTLSVRLLEQAPGRRMVCTPEGRVLLEFVAPYFTRLPGVLRQLTDHTLGCLVVGTEALYVEGLCAAALSELHAALPGVRLRLLELDAPDIQAGLLRGTIDVGLTNLSEQPEVGLKFSVLGELGLQLLVPKGHPLARRRAPLTLQHLHGLRCVVYEEGSRGEKYMRRCLQAGGFGVEPVAEASSAAALEALVRSGLAPAFIPTLVGERRRPRRSTHKDGSVAFDLTDLLRDVLGELPAFGLIRRSGEVVHPLVRDFNDALRRQLS